MTNLLNLRFRAIVKCLQNIAIKFRVNQITKKKIIVCPILHHNWSNAVLLRLVTHEPVGDEAIARPWAQHTIENNQRDVVQSRTVNADFLLGSEKKANFIQARNAACRQLEMEANRTMPKEMVKWPRVNHRQKGDQRSPRPFNRTHSCLETQAS